MGPELWVILVVLTAVLLVGGTVLIILRGGDKPPRLTVEMSSPRIQPHTSRHEWIVEVTATFRNPAKRLLTIGAVSAQAVSAGRNPLDAKRILAEPAGTHHHARVRPPDIALALPIEVLPYAPVRYRFLVFFSSHIRHYWGGGELVLSLRTVNKAFFEASCRLSLPAR